MSFYRNMNLKTKMILSFGIVFMFILGALIYGIYGFSISEKNMESGIRVTEQAILADSIKQDVLQGLLEFKTFMNLDIKSSLDAFEEARSSANNNIRRLKMLNVDEDRENYINNMDKELETFSENFSDVMVIKNESKAYYDLIAETGYRMLDNLDFLQNTSEWDGKTDVYKAVVESIEELLFARLHATKFFDFHTDSEYKNYKEHFEAFMHLIEYFPIDDLSDQELKLYTQIKLDMQGYYDGFEQLYKNVLEQDRLVELMDNASPVIKENADKVIESVSIEQTEGQEDSRDYNNRTGTFMSILMIIGIIIAILVIRHLLVLILVPINMLHSTFLELASNEASTEYRLEESTNDEIGQMSKSFNKFMVNLGHYVSGVDRQNWVIKAQNDMANLVRDEQEIQLLAERLLTYCCSYTKGLVGSFYVKNENEYIRYATYGYSQESKERITDEDNLLGEVIRTKQVKILKDIDSDALISNRLEVNTSLIKKDPVSIGIIPLNYDGVINGIIELGYFREINDDDLIMFEELSKSVAVLVHSAELKMQIRNLLNRTLQQTEELQMQQEELKQSNEELEEQTKALKESETRLQAQQEELRVSNEELEERSRQLELQKAELDLKNREILSSQDAIIRKSKDLEEANRYKSEFLANMSHELRTPLNSILVLSQLLEDRENETPLSSKEKEFAATINRSGNDLLKLINGVLDLSKVEAGRLDLHIEEFSLKQIINDNRALFEPLTEVKNIDFIIENYLKDDDVVVGDTLRLNQILKNLLSNAIKFTHQGYVKMMIRKPTLHEVTKLGCDMNEDVAIEVIDTGIGIKKEKRKLIFEAFKQSDGTTSRNYGGTGLGLTIALELAKLMGGHIVLDSQVGIGSQFTFIFPKDMRGRQETSIDEILQDNDLQPVEKNSHINNSDFSHEKVQEVTPVNTHSNEQILDQEIIQEKIDDSRTYSKENRLLIIEDDEIFAGVLRELAENKGYIVDVAHTGYEGIALAKANIPEGIILDMGLPDIEGLEIAKKLEGNEKTRHIPIHIISGSEEPVVEANVPQSIIGFLKKPVDIKSIYTTLAKIEEFSKEGLKRLLVVGTCGQESFDSFTSLGGIEVVKVSTGEEGLAKLKEEDFGCVVLDSVLEDMKGIDFLTDVNKDNEVKIPVVIYTEEIENQDYNSMKEYADSIILKSSKSKDRLTDEVNLFLHDMKSSLDKYTRNNESAKELAKANVKEKIKVEDSLVGVKVLLVDDDERNVFALTHALEQFGMVITVADNGEEAVKRFKETDALDIVLMDIMMPIMNGYEAIKHIREAEKKGRIPIIALTAKAMKEDRTKCIDAGADDYMTKPINIEQLITLLKVWLA